ncbi:hypothetical protein SAMN05216178_3705 [Pseudomonas saponiphila]|uniref:Uncharacterized protein n=1 Tax=Pseudomonas saponiphila TaxID=556534 RepID=A0A1H4QC55_9PSED|nr:hypothetical protein [Pseudomonas saponiphila]SEC17062.1 hypothetical protein SAMN05216178_3705 [Pseudomonas saponiphila]
MLSPFEDERSRALRQQLQAAFCVFDFVRLTVEPGVAVDQAVHRQGLQHLYQYLMAERREGLEKLRQDPRYADVGVTPMRWEQERAVPEPLSPLQVRQMVREDLEQEGPLALYRAFCQPPYGLRFPGGAEQARQAYGQWLDLLGLDPEQQPHVINWVGNLEVDYQAPAMGPHLLPWSEYFDEGLEWWGVWCLTVWNPVRRTLSMLAASSTD